MIEISCPACGPRLSGEFAFIGDATHTPAVDIDIGSWRRYLYYRDNPAGWAREQWLHTSGCGLVVDVWRDRQTNASAARPPGTVTS